LAAVADATTSRALGPASSPHRVRTTTILLCIAAPAKRPLASPSRIPRKGAAARRRWHYAFVTDRNPKGLPVVTIEDPCSDRARLLLGAYLEDVVSRFHGRLATPAEMALAIADAPTGDLAEPRGVLLLARLDARDVGCVGLRFLASGIGEVTSLFVASHARGRGIGAMLVDELEAIATNHGLDRMRLDTRDDLVEARRLYARQGFREVAAFNEEPYADHWFEKKLLTPS
jgi:ribosomal protein S18 acetylase RimI-like enzyme